MQHTLISCKLCQSISLIAYIFAGSSPIEYYSTQVQPLDSTVLLHCASTSNMHTEYYSIQGHPQT
eukprot:6680522-Ditylum_brightwellii.AAC.1